jgi:hypothetical protein
MGDKKSPSGKGANGTNQRERYTQHLFKYWIYLKRDWFQEEESNHLARP